MATVRSHRRSLHVRHRFFYRWIGGSLPCFTGRIRGSRVIGMVIPQYLYDQAQLTFAQQRLDRADDSPATADLDPVTDSQRCLRAQMTCGENLVRPAKL